MRPKYIKAKDSALVQRDCIRALDFVPGRRYWKNWQHPLGPMESGAYLTDRGYAERIPYG